MDGRCAPFNGRRRGVAASGLSATNHYHLKTTSNAKRAKVAKKNGSDLNFDPANAVVGGNVDMNLTITVKPFEALNQQIIFLTSRLTGDAGVRLVRQDIYRARTNYQFTRDHALRVIVEYNNRTARLDSSYLYSFTPRTNTAIYAGYGDVRSDDVALYGGMREARWQPLQRTVFIKVSYGFRP